MNNFERFQLKNKQRASTATDVGNSSFIKKGFNSTVIECDAIKIQAAVVNQQNNDLAYIYTELKDTLEIGSCWTVKNLHLLVLEETVIIKDVNWHKYKALICNFNIDGLWGRFIGPEEKYIETDLKYSSILISKQKPIIVLPGNEFSCGDKLVIGGRPWLIQESDFISSPGITYYSVMPTTISKDNFVANEDETNTNGIVSYNQIINIPTEDGYFNYSNTNIVIVQRTKTNIQFYMPFGVSEVDISVKENGKVITKTYKAE